MSDDNELIEDYFKEFVRAKNLSSDTERGYVTSLVSLSSYLRDSGISFFVADKEIIENWLWSLQGKISNATANQYLYRIRIFYQFLNSLDVCENPAVHIISLPCSPEKKQSLSIDEAGKVLEHALGTGKTLIEKRDYAVVCLQLRCCVRTKEIVDANIEDFVVTKYDAVLKTKPWGNSAGSVALLDSVTTRALKDYIEARGTVTPSDPLIVSHSNRSLEKRITTRSLTSFLTQAMSSVGKGSRNYSLKRTAIALAAKSGVPQQECLEFARLRSNTLASEVFKEYEQTNGAVHERIAQCLNDASMSNHKTTMKVRDLKALLESFEDDDDIDVSFNADGSLSVFLAPK